MRGLQLDFTAPGGCVVLTDSQVEGLGSTVQNAMVNLGTERGTDKTLPARGTDLLRTAVSSGLPSPNLARHIANFAAVDTLFFSRATDRVTDGDSLQDVTLFPDTLSAQRVVFAARFRSVDGREVGRLPATFVNQG